MLGDFPPGLASSGAGPGNGKPKSYEPFWALVKGVADPLMRRRAHADKGGREVTQSLAGRRRGERLRVLHDKSGREVTLLTGCFLSLTSAIVIGCTGPDDKEICVLAEGRRNSPRGPVSEFWYPLCALPVFAAQLGHNRCLVLASQKKRSSASTSGRARSKLSS